MSTLIPIHAPQVHSGGEARSVKAGEIFFREFREGYRRAISAEGDFGDVKRKSPGVGIGFGLRLGNRRGLSTDLDDQSEGQTKAKNILPHSDSPQWSSIVVHG